MISFIIQQIFPFVNRFSILCVYFRPSLCKLKLQSTERMEKMMKKRVLMALLLLSFALACGACTTQNPPSADDRSDLHESDSAAVSRDECSSVYAKIVSVDGDKLTVSVGERVLALDVRSDLLTGWNEDEQVILFYTGAFGNDMQVHYIDKWNQDNGAHSNSSTQSDASAFPE